MKAQVYCSRKSVSRKRACEEGKIKKTKRNGHQEDEHAEMKAYLGTLQNLVPFAPKNKTLSKLEVISNVIDYIHDLRETLGLQPCNAAVDMDSMSQCGNVQSPTNFEISNNSTS
ncbi:unnamed protein product [Orchesella dallaii]|uniref:BHLH domain-containing protein n=1 Tax=Orchesella dallaii TaxID=48710 RepID=A0ABP1PJ00_9HEXA